LRSFAAKIFQTVENNRESPALAHAHALRVVRQGIVVDSTRTVR